MTSLPRIYLAPLLLLASCNSFDSSTELDGRSFLLESAENFQTVEGTTVRLDFRDGNLTFNAGCNNFFGPYSVCGDALCVEGFGSTEEGCDAALHEQDDELDTLLSSRPLLELDGNRLTLTNNDIETRRGPGFVLVFLNREVADPDRPLEGRTWTVDTRISGDAASTGPGLTGGTLTFDSDGALHVQTSCNTGDGTFVVSGSSITLAEMVYTEEACEDHVQEVMSDGDMSFSIDAARLTILRGDVGLSATTE